MKIQLILNDMPIMVERDSVTKDENGLEYPNDCYLPDMVDGMYIPDMVKAQTEAQSALIKHGEDLVKSYIQKVIDDYNTANGVRFENINNCSLYKDDTTHPHQQFCINIIAFNSLVWKEARVLQVQVITMNPLPTDEEFLAMLPKWGV